MEDKQLQNPWKFELFKFNYPYISYIVAVKCQTLMAIKGNDLCAKNLTYW